MNPAVFLDRDNTLIHNDGDLGDPAQVRLIQGAASAIASLRGLGYRVVVVSNQGGVARGKYTEGDVDAVHQKINDLVKATSATSIDRFYYCPYHPEATVEKYKREHPWRKPAPGMLVQAAKDLDLDLGQSWMIGDQMRDVEAGHAAGVRTILLRTDAEELTPLRLEEIASAQVVRGEGGVVVMPNFTARNLIEAVRIVAQQRKPEPPDEMRLREKTARRWDPQAARATRQGPGGTVPAAGQAGAGTMGTAAPGAAPDTSGGGRGAAPAAKPAPVRQARPFRPWSAEGSGAATAAPATAERPDAPAAAPAHAPLRPGEDAPSPAGPAPDTAASAAERATGEVPAPVPATGAPPAAPAPPPPAAPPGTPATAHEPEAVGTHLTLRQILQELRSQRSTGNDFTWLRFFAACLQVLVVICVGAALILGQQRIATFLYFMDTALVLQLATIAALLF